MYIGKHVFKENHEKKKEKNNMSIAAVTVPLSLPEFGHFCFRLLYFGSVREVMELRFTLQDREIVGDFSLLGLLAKWVR